MKLFFATAVFLAGFCCCFSQEPEPPYPVPSATVQGTIAEKPKALETTVVQAQPASDTDGDLIPDEIDPNPLLPDVPPFSWWVSDVTVGWDLDQSQIDKFQSNSGDESLKQRKTSFTVGGGIGGGGGFSQGVNADPSAIFLSLLPGGNLLKRAGDDFSAQSHLAVSFDLRKTFDREETIKEIRSEFRKLEQQRAIKNRHIEFTVEFFNDTNDVYQFSNFSIPVQTSARQTRAEALCFVAGETRQEFEVPANRPSGYPVRFRAMLSTTQSEQILDALESGDLRLAIDRSNGKAINQTTKLDEIAKRQTISSLVEEKTATLEFRTDGNSTSWRVSKHNPLTGRPTSVAEAIEAINRMVATSRDADYIEMSGGVVYAVGSYRNTPQNAFEVTNATKAPLKVLGWTRMNRYGAVQNGKWAHGLNQPVNQGAVFSWLPYEIKKEELSLQIHTCDPSLSSEWLALCHYWMYYDEKKPFIECPLSITPYPLVPLFQALKPGFAKADFEGMVSNWIARGAGVDRENDGEDGSVDSQDFKTNVRIHRKAILDAAFDGYSEAGALLARIAEPDRDIIESQAIRASLEIGNTDAAAVESCNKLFTDLNAGREVDMGKVKVPEHVFAKNLFGFVRFGECERGLRSGRARDVAKEAFTYSAEMGSPFAQSMKGWLLVNTAAQKRRRLINSPGWDRDRDTGYKLLKEVAPDSVLAKYVLADLLYSNRIGIERDIDLAKRYLLDASEEDFGNAKQIYVERY